MTRQATEYVGGLWHQTPQPLTDSDEYNSQCCHLILWLNRGFRTLNVQMILMEIKGL